jgi:hypothetical protein
MALATPMASGRLTSVTPDRLMLDLIVRDYEPLSIHEHLHAASLHPIMGWSAISVVAATPTCPIDKVQVDVVGLGGTSPKRQQAACEEQRNRNAEYGRKHRSPLS